MQGLATASVLVADNNPDDAVPLIESLSSRGIGTLYLSGQPDKFPAKGTLRGIRLAILDVDLVDGDRPEEVIAGDPVRLLGAIMTSDNGPYLVLLWTASPSLEAAFIDQAKSLEWPPVATFTIAKQDVRDNGGFDPDQIAARVGAALAKVDPLQSMMQWGQMIHNAASATLVAVSPQVTESWIEDVRSLFGSLVRENTPKAWLHDLRQCTSGLFTALDQVHADHLEQATSLMFDADVNVIARVAAKARERQTTNADLQATINRSLLLGPVTDHKAPGSVYRIDSLAKPIQADFRGLLSDTLKTLPDGTTQAKRDERAQVEAEALTLGIEVTPVCDYQQDKHQITRLLGAVAVPVAHVKNHLEERRGGPVRLLPPIRFDDDALTGSYVLALNANYLVTRRGLGRAKARYRLRAEVLADVIAFHGAHSTRPGYLAIRT